MFNYYWCSIVSILFVTSIIQQANGYNVDVVNFVQHNGTNRSMFGFSIALHKESGITSVIIGAPKTNTSHFQPGVIEGGAVFKCETDKDSRCQIIRFDETGNNMNKQHQMDTKSYQWFGATVVSGGIDGPVMACAPRYVWHMPWPGKEPRIEPVGTCFMAMNNFKNFTEYSPCRTIYWGYHRQGSCQAGFSASITKDGERMFIGAPGSWYWQGQVYTFGTKAYSRYGVYSTYESTAFEDYSYKGYSMTTGDFNGDGEQDVAVGMPRGGGLLGKVLIYNWKMENFQNITGEEVGAYFGYSVCSVDVDGDKLDDLIIGAPMHTIPNNEGNYEMGRVFVMYQNLTDKFEYTHILNGTTSKGRFGLAVVSLNDINMDGYGDFAVAAPYGGPNGEGIVYIYHGSPRGVREKYSQAITPSSMLGMSAAGIRTFGFAMSGGIDVDDNGYPDLVIGAYESDKVFLFRSRPVARVTATTTFKAADKLVSLEHKNCKTPDRTEVVCTILESCLSFDGIKLPPTVDVAVRWNLDSKKPKTGRMFFLDDGLNERNMTIRLHENRRECKTFEVYLKNNIRDKLTALEVEMHYKLWTRADTGEKLVRVPRALLEAVIDENYGTIQKDSINIQKNCGPDNICTPNLSLNVTGVDKYLLGSRKHLVIDVAIKNSGEDAFEAGFYMTVPESLDFTKFERVGDLRDPPLTCTAPNPANNHILKCDLGNPLPANGVQNFKVRFMPSHRSVQQPIYSFYVEVNSTNAEDAGTRMDNFYTKNVTAWIETDLSIEGISVPESFHYNISQYPRIRNASIEQDIGHHVVHVYNVRNNGPSTIESADIYILVPHSTLSGDRLFYILNEPETSVHMNCTGAEPNDAGVTLDAQLAQRSYLRQIGAISKPALTDFQTGTKPSVTTQVRKPSDQGTGGQPTYGKELTEEDKKKLDAELHKESPGDPSVEYNERVKAEQRRQEEWLKQWADSRVGKITIINATHLIDGTPINKWRFGQQGSQDAITIQNSTHLSNGVLIKFWNDLWDSGKLKVTNANLKLFNATHWSDGVAIHDRAALDQVDRNGQIVFWNGDVGSISIDGKPLDTFLLSDGHSFQKWLQSAYGQSGFGGTTTTHHSSSVTTIDGSPTVHTYYNRTTITGPNRTVQVYETSTEYYSGGGNVEYQGGNVHSVHQLGGSQGGYHQQGHYGGSQSGYQQQGHYGGSQGGYRQQGHYDGSQSGHRNNSYQQNYHTSQTSQGSHGGGTYHGSQSGEHGVNIALAGIGGHHSVQGTGTQTRPKPLGTYEQSFQTGGTQSQGQGSYQQGTFEQSYQTGGSQSQGQGSYQQGTYHQGGSTGGAMHTSGHYGQGSHDSSRGKIGKVEDIVVEATVNKDLLDHTSAPPVRNDGRRRMKSQQDGKPFEADLVRGAVTLEENRGGRAHVGVLDLGVLGGSNTIDGDSRGSQGSSHYSSGGHSYYQTGGRGSGSYTSSVHGSSGYSPRGQATGTQYSERQGSTSYGRDSGHHAYEQQRSGQIRSGGSFDRTSGGSYRSRETVNPSFNDDDTRRREDDVEYYDEIDAEPTSHDRYRRDTDEDHEQNLKDALSCYPFSCRTIKCTTGPLANDEGVWIAIRTRLVAKTLHKLAGDHPIKLSTKAVAHIAKLPFVGEPGLKPLKDFEVTVVAEPEKPPKVSIVPLWVVVVAACAGAIILLLLIFLLYKCGFFKRERPKMSQERQPLNRNGGYHGDEHL